MILDQQNGKWSIHVTFNHNLHGYMIYFSIAVLSIVIAAALIIMLVKNFHKIPSYHNDKSRGQNKRCGYELNKRKICSDWLFEVIMEIDIRKLMALLEHFGWAKASIFWRVIIVCNWPRKRQKCGEKGR